MELLFPSDSKLVCISTQKRTVAKYFLKASLVMVKAVNCCEIEVNSAFRPELLAVLVQALRNQPTWVIDAANIYHHVQALQHLGVSAPSNR